MNDIITSASQVKPDFLDVKRRWSKLLRKYFDNNNELKKEYTTQVNCQHCGSCSTYNSFKLNGFSHHTCNNCDCVYVNPRLTNQVLQELYSDEYYNEMFNRSMLPYFKKRKKLIGQSKYNQIMTHLKDSGRDIEYPLKVLDIGAGIGEVLSVFKDHDSDCYAIEVNKVATEHLRSLDIDVFNDSFFNYPDSHRDYDVIMAWGVIEHITDPELFLEKVYAILKPSGLFVSEVPHSQSLLVDYCRQYKKDPLRILQGEQHIILYSKSAYVDLHAKSGLTLSHIQTNGLDVSTIQGDNRHPLDQDIIPRIQSVIDSYMKGDLLRGFWTKG